MMPRMPTTPNAVTAQNVERQPKLWPSRVPRGTPMTLATVSPMNIRAMALAFLAGATRFAATTEPMPKNAPWVRAATRRPVMSSA